MLTNLHVKNLALIDEAEVEFGPGLNILTGETGAGKSILIGSINAALGKKISREMIRTGETSALVELVFETENPHVLELLKETDLGAEEGQVIISRKITGSRSVCRINGEACNISQVKALASLLLDIHGQHEHQSLLYPDRQIAILDAFAGTEAATAKGEVRALYQEWKNVRKELSAYELDEEARKREAAFLTFEINEIDQAELKEGEDEALETAYRKMGHAKKIAESLQTVYAITGYGAENSAGEQVGRAIRELQQAAVYDDALSGPSQTLSDIDGLLNDFNREISAYLSELTFSEEEYYETEKRLDEINRLKAKYGKTMEEIAAYRGSEHTPANKARVSRFMAGAATGDHRHAAFIPVAASHHADGRIDIQFDEITVRRGEKYAFNGIVDQLFAIVKEESGHNIPKKRKPYAKHSPHWILRRKMDNLPHRNVIVLPILDAE